MKFKKRLFSMIALLLCLGLCSTLLSGFATLVNNLGAEPLQTHAPITSTGQPIVNNRGQTTRLQTYSFNIPDNNYFDRTTPGTSFIHPLGRPLANIYLHTPSSDSFFEQAVVNRNGFPAYGIVSGSDIDNIHGKMVEVRLRYGWNRTTNLNGWDISRDTWRNGIRMPCGQILNPGPIWNGALMVQKSETGLCGSWEWQNTVTQGIATSYNTNDLTYIFPPHRFSGNLTTENEWTTQRDWHEGERERAFDRLQNQINQRIQDAKDRGEVYDGPHIATFPHTFYRDRFTRVTYTDTEIVFNHTSDGKLTIFTPLGTDINRGVYIRVIFAYELRHRTNGTFRNILEETIFFLCNSSGEILFQNIHFADETEYDDLSDEEIDERQETMQLIRQFGTIKNNHASNAGFRLNFQDITSNTVRYRKNGSNNWQSAYHNQMFFVPGRYEFKVITELSTVRNFTIFINEEGSVRNLQKYFGGNLICGTSHRVFSTSHNHPVFVAYRTWWQTRQISLNHMPLVGRIYRVNSFTDALMREIPSGNYNEEGEPIMTRIFNGEQVGSQIGQNGVGVRTPQRGVITEAGYYRAIFANNQDFFTNENSGDTFRFIFEFVVVDTGIGPAINEELIRSNIGFSDFEAGHWGVSIRNDADNAYITFAFADRASAHSFAVTYLASSRRTTIVSNQFYFDGNFYTSFLAVSRAHALAADSLVQRRHFDATNEATFRTIEGALGHETILNPDYDPDDPDSYDSITIFNSILANVDINRDIVVFAGATDALVNRVDFLPFLNDRKFSWLNEEGVWETGFTPLRFIQAADFETSRITLVHIDSEPILSFEVPFGVPVQEFLVGRQAPTGRYRIIEYNINNERTIYYGIFIRPGDITTSIVTERFLNGGTTRQTLSQANANVRLSANGFVIRSASNALDPFGIVRIENIGTGQVDIFQLNEVDNIVINQNGNYRIVLVDRLGNSTKFYVDIFTAADSHTLTLMNNGEQFSQQLVFGGQRVDLEMPISNDPANLEFIGWRDPLGNIHRDSFVFTAHSDITLEAVWHFINTIVNIIDGRDTWTEVIRPGGRLPLPMPERSGFTFFGFMDSVTSRVYFGQITTVPNVSQMTLRGMWMDNAITHTANAGQNIALPEPAEREGFIFAGWLYEISNIEGYIFRPGESITEIDNDILLVSLWYACPDYVDGRANFWGLMAGITTIAGPIIVGGALLILAGLFLAKLLRKLKNTNFAPRPQVALATLGSIEEQPTKVAPILMTADDRSVREKTRGLSLPSVPRIFTKKNWFASIALGMIVVMVAIGSWQLMLNLRHNIEVNRISAALQRDWQRQIDASQQRYAARVTAQQQSDRLFLATQTFNQSYTISLTSGIEEEIQSELDAFLFSVVSLDLMLLGYDVFPAAIKHNGEKFRGLAYTDYFTPFESEDAESDRIYFGSGFVSLFGEPVITQADIEAGIQIKPVGEEGIETSSYYGFLLTFEEYLGPLHFIAFEHYIKYSIRDFRITSERTAIRDNPSLYDLGPEFDVFEIAPDDITHPIFDLSLGFLFSYDHGLPVFDPAIGIREFTADAFSITEAFDFDFAQMAYEAFAHEQLDFGINIDSVTTIHIGENAIAQFMLNNQDESFLGLTPEEIFFLEAMLPENTHFYFIDEHGELNMLEIPQDPARRASFWQRLAMAIAAVLVVVVTIFVVAITFGAAAPLGALIIGAVVGVAIELIMQVTVFGVHPSDINVTKVVVSGVIGALSGAAGAWVGAIGSGAQVVTKMTRAVKWGLHALNAAMAGGISGALYAWIDGAALWSSEFWISFGIGFATGFAIYFGTQMISTITKHIARKFRPAPVLPNNAGMNGMSPDVLIGTDLTPNQIGRMGENTARKFGLRPNKQMFRVRLDDGTFVNVIPDGVVWLNDVQGGTMLRVQEVKNRATLSNTRQMRGLMQLAQDRGVPFDLFIRRGTGTHLSAPLVDAINQTNRMHGDNIIRILTRAGL